MKKTYIALLVLVIGVVAYFIINKPDSSLNGLDGRPWELYSVVYTDNREILPIKEGDFVLTLKDDSTFSLKTDCNSIGGEYISEGNLITFKNIFSTKMYCEGSKEAEIKGALEKSKSFFYDQNGSLVIEMEGDKGSIYFK